LQRLESVVASRDDRWTKWWWIAYFGLDAWTPVERKVRIALGMTALVFFLMIYLLVVEIFLLIGIERHYAAVTAGAVSIVLAFLAARPFAIVFFPASLEEADANSRRRLSEAATDATQG
jgi:hypothetical protein